MPINEALALNHESTESVAFAEADQALVCAELESDEFARVGWLG